jgi:probable F420-dependent oxidoreductase
MECGLFLPVSGRSATRGTLQEYAQFAERLGFRQLWAAERVVIPWNIETAYPYAEGATFIVPPDRPFLESLTVLAFLAGCTERIKLGVSVLVLPYRHPLHWAKVASTIDVLSEGRFTLGVGVGWMKEEFDALNAPFAERGQVSDEQLEMLWGALSEEHSSFASKHYAFRDIAFNPKGFKRTRLPIWVGGEGPAAQKRAARYGDAWFPYFLRITPADLAERFANVRRQAAAFGRNPSEIALNLNLPVWITDTPVEQEPGVVRGTADQVATTIEAISSVGVQHLALQFMVPHYPERLVQIERFATTVLPRLEGSKAAQPTSQSPTSDGSSGFSP